MNDTVKRDCRIWLLTGDPGSGKTTLVSKVLYSLRTKGFSVGGVLTREIRKSGEREGFLLVDVSSEESAVMATTKRIPGPRVGRYHIDLNVLSGLASKALEHARQRSDFVVCDEVGPMELYSPEFRRSVIRTVLDSSKPCLCVLHKRLEDPLIEKLKESDESQLVEVSYDNREGLPQLLSSEIISLLNSKRKGR